MMSDQDESVAESPEKADVSQEAKASDKTLAETDPAERRSGEPSDPETPGADAEQTAEAAEIPEPSGEEIARVMALFTRAPRDDAGPRFQFARWGRPIRPAVFGVDAASAETIVAGFAKTAEDAGLGVVEDDPELGANLLIFFCETWADLLDAPGLDRLAPDLPGLTRALEASDANQYRLFNLDEAGAVRAAIVLIRYDDAMAAQSPEALALHQAVQTLLLWSDKAFAEEAPVSLRRDGRATVRSWFGRLLRAAYAEETPTATDDPMVAEALARRMAAMPRGRGRGGRTRGETPRGERASGKRGRGRSEKSAPPAEEAAQKQPIDTETVETEATGREAISADEPPAIETPTVETPTIETPEPQSAAAQSAESEVAESEAAEAAGAQPETPPAPKSDGENETKSEAAPKPARRSARRRSAAAAEGDGDA